MQTIEQWWLDEGSQAYPNARRLLILADAGGSSSCRSRVWKTRLQRLLCDSHGLSVTVCHYPTGCSKWNSIEHRLFSAISRNCACVPMRSFETLARHISGTTPISGLRVRAVMSRGGNELGERPSQMEDLRVRLLTRHHRVGPQWNYTLRPEPNPSEDW